VEHNCIAVVFVLDINVPKKMEIENAGWSRDNGNLWPWLPVGFLSKRLYNWND
jgi:hypothetical protein